MIRLLSARIVLFSATTCFCLLSCFAPAIAWAATLDSNATGAWSSAGTWSPAQSPTSSDYMRIGIGTNHVVTVTGSDVGQSTEIGNWGGGSTLRIQDGASLTLTNDFLNDGPPSNATVFRGAGYGGSISANRLFVQFGAVLESRPGDAFTSLVQVQFNNSSFTQTSNLSPATVYIGNGTATYTLQSGTLSVAGDLDLLSGSGGGGQFVQTGGTVSANRLLVGSSETATLTQNSSFNILDVRGTGLVTNSVGGTVLTGVAANTWDTSSGVGTINLNFADVTSSGLVWGLRLSGDKTTQLTTLLGSGDLVINDTASLYSPSIFYDGSAFTYVGANVIVPEPSSLALLGAGALFVLRARRGWTRAR